MSTQCLIVCEHVGIGRAKLPLSRDGSIELGLGRSVALRSVALRKPHTPAEEPKYLKLPETPMRLDFGNESSGVAIEEPAIRAAA
jgi:hypothetical protein